MEVRVREGVEPTYGWGRVRKGDVGVVARVDGDKCKAGQRCDGVEDDGRQVKAEAGAEDTEEVGVTVRESSNRTNTKDRGRQGKLYS
eukprot:gene10622-biopygen5125